MVKRRVMLPENRVAGDPCAPYLLIGKSSTLWRERTMTIVPEYYVQVDKAR